MKPQHLKVLRLRLVGILVLSVSLASPAALLAAECDDWVAQILSAQGQVEVIRGGASRAEVVSSGETRLCPGDTLRAGALSKATLLLANQTRATIDEATEFTFPETASSNPNCQRAGSSNRPLVEILKGAIRFISRTPTSLDICAPYVNAAIEGTEFVVRAKPAENYVWVSEGRVVASNAQGSMSLNPGEGVVAEAGAALRRITIKPEDATQWSLYYPPVIDYRAEMYSTGPSAPTIANAIAAYRKNDLSAAFAQLEEIPEASRNAEYYGLRAGLLLSAGRVEEALAETEEALRIDPAQGIAYALQSIVAVTQNESEEALTLAKKAQQLKPESSVPEIALSYAYQARFDIEKARDSVRKAVKLSPEDALAWSRLAELELSMGDLNEALIAAEQAEKLDPDLARTQTVLGFAYLTQIDIGEAKTAFRKAIDFDPAAPLPHLGLGLATIRQGDLDEGTKEIETAAILDPDNALVRSYLGKAYYEQKRGGLATTELIVAKELDPNDPTPWFYDAIRKQTANRPVEALHDIQKAIELNDNRAVYRSSLLLDQDEAARSAAQGRIYNNLGFQRLGLVQGWKSVTTDPSNYSAHKLLADNYLAQPRHEIARASEFLQAQLLQPINVNPIQLRLALTDLNLVTGSGFENSAFNEFTPMFERNRVRLIASGLFGNNGTRGNEAVFSGLYDKWSFSAGRLNSDTDGFRDNNDVKNDIYNFFTQVAITPKFNAQAEYRKRETTQGDLGLNFDPSEFSKNESRKLDQDTGRVGFRFSPSSKSDFVLSLIYTSRKEILNINFPDVLIREFAENDGYQAEAQYMFRHERLNIEVGGGNYEFDVDDRDTFDFAPEPCLIPTGCITKDNFTRKQNSAYFYSNFALPRTFTWTVGVEYDEYEEPDLDVNKFYPKLGLQWGITDDIQLRVAGFKTLKQAIVVAQTIRPTQVAGFNQFFDDFNGTEAWRYGFGADLRFAERLYGGIEVSRRDLEVPIEDFETSLFNIEDRKEDLYRAYLSWTPISELAIRASFEYERFKRPANGDDPFKIITSTVPFGVRYFIDAGFFVDLGITSVHQKVNRVPNPTATNDGKNNFILLDASVGYRLPNQRGILSVEANNLLDEEFNYQDDDFRTNERRIPRFIPDSQFLVRLTLSF